MERKTRPAHRPADAPALREPAPLHQRAAKAHWPRGKYPSRPRAAKRAPAACAAAPAQWGWPVLAVRVISATPRRGQVVAHAAQPQAKRMEPRNTWTSTPSSRTLCGTHLPISCLDQTR